MIYLLGVPVAALAWAWLDLFAFNAGTGFRYRPGLPEEVRFRVRRNSWLVRLVNPPKARWSGMAVGRTMHLASVPGVALSPWLVAHEMAHVIRQRGRVVSYLLRYAVDSQFRAREEKACDAWALAHYQEPIFASVARIMGGGQA
jgi:hypothetical protein